MIEDTIHDALNDVDVDTRPEFVDELEARLANEFDGVVELSDLPTKSRRRKARALVAVAAVLVTTLAVATVLIRQRNEGGQKPTISNPPIVAPQTKADAFAHELLEQVTVPPGSVVTTATGTPPLDPPVDSGGSTIRLHRFWLVPLPMSEVESFLDAHQFPGTHESTGSSGTTSDGITTTSLNFEPSLSDRDLADPIVTLNIASSTDTNTSIVRADVSVSWRIARPADEHIPERDVVVVITPSATSEPHVVSSPEDVRRLVAAFEDARTAISGIVSCPADLGITYRLAFAPSATERPDVVVTVSTSGCRTARVEIGGHESVSLDGGGLLAVARPFLRGLTPGP